MRYQRRRPNQKPCGLACGFPYQTLPGSVLAERTPLVHLAWSGALTIPYQSPIWLCLHSITLLPIITSRGVKYTHDIKHRILHSNRGPTRIRLIPQASDQKKVVVGDGGAKHRSIDPPTTWHSVADPHAVATIHQGGPPGLDPTTTSSWAYGVYSVIEASNFGKEFLRMAGIVQMLHALQPPYDKYPYAHPERVRQSTTSQRSRRDHYPAWRPRFLDHAVPDHGSSLIVRTVVITLALYGLYSCSHYCSTLSVPSISCISFTTLATESYANSHIVISKVESVRILSGVGVKNIVRNLLCKLVGICPDYQVHRSIGKFERTHRLLDAGRRPALPITR